MINLENDGYNDVKLVKKTYVCTIILSIRFVTVMKQTIINKMQAFFPTYPVEKAWIFGSYARGEETRKSDIDIMVRFDRNATVTLIDYARIMNNLSDLLRKKVDLVQEGTLYKFAQESVERDKILVYERNN